MIFAEVDGKGHGCVNRLAGACKEGSLNAEMMWLKSWCVIFFCLFVNVANIFRTGILE